MTRIEKQRLGWIDVVKFLGIIFIYIGHLGTNAGKIYPFVFIFHVPLFFFTAGFFTNEKLGVIEFIKKKTFDIFIPYVIFSIIFVFGTIIISNGESNQLIESAIPYFKGVRNTLPAASLWFLPCVFIVSILHHLVSKVFKDKRLLILISLVARYVAVKLLPNNPIAIPTIFMNFDSALYYWIFYTVGDYTFQFYKELYVHKILKGILFFITGFITYISYFKYSWFYEKIKFINKSIYISEIFGIVIIVSIITFFILVSFYLENISFFKEYGKETLMFVGLENIVSFSFPIIWSTLGLNLNISNNLSSLVYVIIRLVFTYKVIIPLVKSIPFFKMKKSS